MDEATKQRPLSPHIEHDKDPSLLRGIKRWAKALILLPSAGNGMSTFSSWTLNTIKVTKAESGMDSYLKYFFTKVVLLLWCILNLDILSNFNKLKLFKFTFNTCTDIMLLRHRTMEPAWVPVLPEESSSPRDLENFQTNHTDYWV